MADDFYAPVYGPTSRGGMVPPPGSAPRPTGDTGLAGFAEAPIAGAFEAAGQLGSAVQGGAKLLGADSLADAAGEWAKRRQAQAATYTAPEAPGSAWYSPGNLTRTLLRGAPLVAGGAAAAAASPFEGTLGAGAMAAGAFAPFMFGQNVQTSEAVPGQQNLTKQQAAKAALLAVPEAAVGAVPFGGAIVRGAEQPILHTAATMAAASAAQDAIGQAMGDPNRTMTSRMSEVLQSAVTGGITGGIVGRGRSSKRC